VRLDADRQLRADPVHLALDVPAERQDVAALCMAMASPIAGSPFTRNIGWGGSAKPRVTVAMSPSRITRPRATKFTSSTSRSDRKAPETRIDTRSSSVFTTPEGTTRFWAWSAATSAARSSPRPASASSENSTKIRSSWAPSTSILETSGTRSSRERASSTWSRSSRCEKPSAVKP
jgi:hypothetical protein